MNSLQACHTQGARARSQSRLKGENSTHEARRSIRPFVVGRDDLAAKVFCTWGEELVYSAAAIIQDGVGLRNLAARHRDGLEQLEERHLG